jgi:hypothetical protein
LINFDIYKIITNKKIIDMSSQIKNAIFLSLVFLGVFFSAKQFIVKKDHKFPVTYISAVERPGYETAPAEWRIDISPALALEKTKEFGNHKAMAIIAIIFLVASIAWIFVSATDILNLKGSTPNYVLFLLLLGYLGFEYGAYSGALVNNTVSVPEAQFEKMTGVKDHTVKYVTDNENKDIEKLFDKPIVR